jgi:TonB family protein
MYSFAAILVATSTLVTPPMPNSGSLLAQETEGKVVLECLVAPTGSLNDCLVVEETPVGHGLGQRALTQAAALKMDVKIVGGMPVEGARVRIPFSFKL